MQYLLHKPQGSKQGLSCALRVACACGQVVNAAQHLLGMLDVQRIISTAKKRGDAQGVLIGMRAGIDSNAAQHLGCEAIAMLAYQADSLFNRPTELHRMPHGAKYGASKHPGYEKTPNPPRLAGCVEAVFDAMVTHQRIGPVQGAGCWALAALAAAIPVCGALPRHSEPPILLVVFMLEQPL